MQVKGAEFFKMLALLLTFGIFYALVHTNGSCDMSACVSPCTGCHKAGVAAWVSATVRWFHSLSFGRYVVVINLLALSFSHLLDFHQFWQRNWSAVGNG